MRVLVSLLIILLWFSPVNAQGRKELKAARVKSATTMQTSYKEGKEYTWKDSYEEYDRNGRTTLIIKYDKNGKVKNKETYKYDNEGNKLEEAEWKNGDSLVYHKKYTVNSSGYRTEEYILNATGNIIEKTIYKLDAYGNKLTETVYNSSGNIKKTITYIYNNKRLKTERKTTDSKGKTEVIKKYTYEYY